MRSHLVEALGIGPVGVGASYAIECGDRMAGTPPGPGPLRVHDRYSCVGLTWGIVSLGEGAGEAGLRHGRSHSERAALIYQHEARGADKRITDAIDFHVQAERDQGDDDGGAAGTLVPAG